MMSKKTVTRVRLLDIPAFSKQNIEKFINDTIDEMKDATIKSVSLNPSYSNNVAVITYDTTIDVDDDTPENRDVRESYRGSHRTSSLIFKGIKRD